MKNKFRALITIFSTWIWLPTHADENLGCYNELREIVESSNSNKIVNKGASIVSLIIDTDENNIILARLRLTEKSTQHINESEWQGTQTAGWIKFFEHEGTLYELPLNEDDPLIELNTKCSLVEKFKKCRDEKRRNSENIEYQRHLRVTAKGRSYFHETPTTSNKLPNLFLVNGDVVTEISTSGAFTEIIYTQKSGGQVRGWLKTEDLMDIPSLD